MKLSVLDEPRFTCSTCAAGCRNWHVELLKDEIQSVQKLAWPVDDPLHGVRGTMKFGSRTYLAHAPDGVCVFLNRQNNLCRIHADFGVDAKPLGCRLYPFQISPTFDGQATVSPRYTCPTVRANVGVSHREALPELRELAGRMQFPAFFNSTTTCNLDPEQVKAVCEFVSTLLNAFPTNDQRSLFLLATCDFLTTLTADQVDRAALGQAFLQLKQTVENIVTIPVKRPGWLFRVAFRMFLGLHLRRDEDVLDGRASRFGRLWGMVKFALGTGSFKNLGVTHPGGQVKSAMLFSPEFHCSDPEIFELHWRMVGVKLLSLHFMGAANYNRDLLSGLRSLALLFPLVASAAKYRAGNRGASAVEVQDVDYGVSVIEHAFGRSPVLSQGFAGSLEKHLLEPGMFLRVVQTI